MKFSLFYTKAPRKFNHKPMYYSPEREEREKQRTRMGLNPELSHEDELRIKLASRWRKEEKPVFEDRFRRVKIIVFGIVVVVTVYVVFFTNVLENLIKGLGAH